MTVWPQQTRNRINRTLLTQKPKLNDPHSMILTSSEMAEPVWIGECLASGRVRGLFDASLSVKSTDAVEPGDIVLVNTEPRSSETELLTPDPAINKDPGLKKPGSKNPGSENPGSKKTGSKKNGLTKNQLAGSYSITLLATADSAKATVYRILKQHGLNPIHPPSVLSDARRFLPFNPDQHEALADLQALPFVTIDNEDSKDLDQALYVESNGDSSFTVYYALADAAWFIKPDTPLFEEALTRGVTYYAPNLAVTMLPALLSEDLISLNPNVVRRAVVFRIKVRRDGSAGSCDVYRATIKSRAKLSYAGVQHFYDTIAPNGSQHRDHEWQHAEWADSLLALKDVGLLRLAQADMRDVVNYNRRESRVHIDQNDPTQFVISVRERLDSELYNEQISLLCNIEGARLLKALGRMSAELQAIYRVHLPPLSNRMREFRDRLDAIIEARQLSSDWQWPDNTTLADYIDSLPNSPRDARVKQAIERLVMMTNRASGYAAEPDVHHALSVEAYARFSSPMREMVGVFTHKELMEALEFEPSWNSAEDLSVREQIIESANLAKSRQRKLEKAFQLEALQCFLKQDLSLAEPERPARAATVTGMRGNRVYVHVDGFAMDIKIYLDDLGERCGCRYSVDDVSATPSVKGQPTFIIGDGVKLTTQRWCPNKNRYLFNIVPLEY